jgi:hypothetical protein
MERKHEDDSAEGCQGNALGSCRRGRGRRRPSLITRHGKEEAVVISVVEYKRLTNKIPSFGELLMSFPGGADDLPLRSRKPLRDLF